MKNVDNIGKIASRTVHSRVIWHSLFVIFFGIVCLFAPAKSFALSENRWLLVYNTSSAMRDRLKGVEATTYDLLTTAMHGNLRAGDTIGIWTFNNKLRADEAPLQKWSPATAPSVMQNTLQFLDQHPYEGSAAFGDVLTNLLRVVKTSDVITIVLFSDGSDVISGTPFDLSISSYYKTNYQPQKKVRMPIVTLFHGEKGILTTNTFALAPWPLDIPAVPPPAPVVAKAVAPKPVPVPAKPVPSLVIIGKKAETTFNPPLDLPEHVDQVTLPTAPEPPPVAAKVEVVTPAPEPAPAAKVEEKPAPVVVPVVSAPTPAPAVVAESPKTAPVPEVTVASVPSTNPPPETVVAALPVPTAVVVPEMNLLSVRNITIFSVAFTVLVCVLLILAARNARNSSRVSLITRSLDRERK